MATKTQLELFTKLTSNDKAIRLSSAAQLIDSLSNEEELKYSLNRLTKGLSSGRESARIGFAVALTEVYTFQPYYLSCLCIFLLKLTKN